MKLKRIFSLVMVVLMVLALISIYSLGSKMGDQEFLARVNDRNLRAQHIEWIEQHYLPIQVFSIAFVIFVIYTLVNFINSDYIDGKTYKIIIFFLVNGVALVRAVFINQRLYYAGKMASNGELPTVAYLLYPLLSISLIYLAGQLLERSIKNEYFKEAKNAEGTDYSNNWKKLESTLKDASKNHRKIK